MAAVGQVDCIYWCGKTPTEHIIAQGMQTLGCESKWGHSVKVLSTMLPALSENNLHLNILFTSALMAPVDKLVSDFPLRSQSFRHHLPSLFDVFCSQCLLP